jgi:resuscitation-promoting factor RpfA
MGRAGAAARRATVALLLAVVGTAAVALTRAATTEATRLWAERAHLVFGDLVLAVALAVLAIAAGWLCLALGLTAATHTLRRTHGAAHRLAGALTPPLCRRLVAGLLGGVCGAAVLAGPGGGSLAAAAGGAHGPTGPCPLRIGTGDGACLPYPDRPVGAAGGAGTAPAGITPTRAGPVVVRRGDTLWAIAARHLPDGAGDAAIAAAWPAWFAFNRDRIGADPHLLHPGTRLRVPADLR